MPHLQIADSPGRIPPAQHHGHYWVRGADQADGRWAAFPIPAGQALFYVAEVTSSYLVNAGTSMKSAGLIVPFDAHPDGFMGYMKFYSCSIKIICSCITEVA